MIKCLEINGHDDDDDVVEKWVWGSMDHLGSHFWSPSDSVLFTVRFLVVGPIYGYTARRNARSDNFSVTFHAFIFKQFFFQVNVSMNLNQLLVLK